MTFPFDFNPTGRLEALRQGFPTPLGGRHAEFLVRACQVVGFGAGLLKKDGGTHVTLPNGVTVSQDWMVFPNGSGTDFLSDGENAAGVGWGAAQPNPGTLVDVSGLFTEPEPDPEPQPDGALAADVAKLKAGLASTQEALVHLGAHVESQDRQIADLLARPIGGTLPADVARKGDPVTAAGVIDLGFRKIPIVGHGTIDR